MNTQMLENLENSLAQLPILLQVEILLELYENSDRSRVEFSPHLNLLNHPCFLQIKKFILNLSNEEENGFAGRPPTKLPTELRYATDLTNKQNSFFL